MADKKISQLTAVTMPLAETEVLPIVQSGTTKKVTVAELTTLIKHTMTMDGTNALQFGDAGYTASIAYNGDGSLRIKPRSGYPLQIDLANVKFSNSGYGIDFSANANAPGMTSEVLTWYEEGIWTPTYVGWTTSPTTDFAKYTRIGRVVTLNFTAHDGVSLTGSSEIGGLPFTSNSQQGASVLMKDISGAAISAFGGIGANTNSIGAITSATFTGLYWSFSVSYIV